MSRKSKLTRAAALLAAALMTFSAASCNSGTESPQDSAAEATTAPAETTVPEETTTKAATTTTIKITTTTTTTLAPLPVLDEYQEWVDKNDDIKGWIKVGGTPIDYPCVQGTDNSYYLEHDYEKNEIRNGACFIDYLCEFTTRTRPANIIIYGHNMRSGPSFAKLTTYCPWYYTGYNKSGTGFSISQYTENPTITFNTVWEEGTYKVFAAMFVNTMQEHGDVFRYYRQRTITSEYEFYNYIANILDRSQFYTDVDLQYGDELLTLSTCYYPLGNNVDTRFVVFARRVREGESTEVDVSKATINYDPLYFKYWYQVYGGSWGGRKWDTSKIKGLDEYMKNHPDEEIGVIPAEQ